MGWDGMMSCGEKDAACHFFRRLPCSDRDVRRAGTLLRLCFVACGKRESWLRMQAMVGGTSTKHLDALTQNNGCETRRGSRSRWPRFGMPTAIWGGLRRKRQRDKPALELATHIIVVLRAI